MDKGLRKEFSVLCLAWIATMLKRKAQCLVNKCGRTAARRATKSQGMKPASKNVLPGQPWKNEKNITHNTHIHLTSFKFRTSNLKEACGDDNLWSFVPTFQSQTHASVDQLWHEPSLQTHLWQHGMSGWVASFQSLRHHSDNIYSYLFTRMKCPGDLMESNAIEQLCKKPSVTATWAHVWIGTIVVGSFAEMTSLAAALSDMKFKSRPLRRCESVWQVLQTSSSFLLLHVDNHRPHVLINYTILHFRFDYSSGSVRRDRIYMWK